MKSLANIERIIGFSYPPSFALHIEELQDLLLSEGFRQSFSDTQLILDAAEIVAARVNMPESLLPFMRQHQSAWPDIYAFDLGSDGPEFRVVVWSDHAIVADWSSYSVFFDWVHQHIAKHSSAA